MPMFVGQSDARMAWMQGQQQQDMENRRAQHEQRMRDKAQRDQAAAEQAEMAQRERMQGQAIAAQQASQSFAANRASSDAYNARNDAYSTATDPRLAAIERLRLNEATGRESALMGVQSGNRINEHHEGMLDDRARQMGVANNQARLDSALTMQRGNIDARLQGQQGQNALALHQYDAVSKAEADLRNKEMAIQERNGQMMQTGQFSEGDQTYLQGLEEQKQNLRTARDEKRITDTQYITGMHSLLTKEAGRLPTQKRVSFGEQFDQASKTLPDGRIVYNTGKGIGVSNPPAGVKPEMVDPDAKAAKAQAELEKLAGTIQKNSGIDSTSGKPNMDFRQAMQEAYKLRSVKDGQYEEPKEQGQPPADPQELFRHVQKVNQLASQVGIPVQQFVQQLAQKNPAAAEAYVSGLRMIQQAQGGPGADPRAAAVQPGGDPGHQSQGQPVPRMVPGQPGPNVDPRMMQMQGQPAQAPPERPMVGQNQRTGEAKDWTVNPQIRDLRDKHLLAAQGLGADPVVQKAIANGHPGAKNAAGELQKLLIEQAKSVASNGTFGDKTERIRYLTSVLRQMSSGRYEPTPADKTSEYMLPSGQ